MWPIEQKKYTYYSSFLLLPALFYIYKALKGELLLHVYLVITFNLCCSEQPTATFALIFE